MRFLYYANIAQKNCHCASFYAIIATLAVWCVNIAVLRRFYGRGAHIFCSVSSAYSIAYTRERRRAGATFCAMRVALFLHLSSRRLYISTNYKQANDESLIVVFVAYGVEFTPPQICEAIIGYICEVNLIQISKLLWENCLHTLPLWR